MLRNRIFSRCYLFFLLSDANRMRKVMDKYQNLDIQHRSFALGWESRTL